MGWAKPRGSGHLWSTERMLRKVTIIAAALELLLGLALVGISALFTSIENDVFNGGPTRAIFVDRAVGAVNPRLQGLAGDLLLTSKYTTGKLAIRPLADLSSEPLTLLGVVSVNDVGPGGRYVVAWTGTRSEVIRVADLHVVAEIQGADPFFIDSDRVLVVFRGDRCRRRDAMILDLRNRTQHKVKLFGDKAGLTPLVFGGGKVVAERTELGDSDCTAAGFALVDLASGAITTIATAGSVSAVTESHVWINDYDKSKVFTLTGRLVGTITSRLTAEAVEGGVVYAELPTRSRVDGLPPDPPTPLRLGRPMGPRPVDVAGDELRDPTEIMLVQDGKAVLVAHRGRDLPNGGHGTVLSKCSVPQLACQELLDVTQERVVGIVPAAAFKA